MKVKITLLAVLATTFCAFAQVTPTLQHNDLDNNNTLGDVEDIAVYNNDLYYSVPEAGKIVKISLSTPNATITDVVTGLNFPSALAVVGNELYFLQTANAAMQPNTGKLCKIDLTAANPAVTTLYGTLHYPIELAMNGSTAYVGETYLVGPVGNFDVDHMELSVVTGTTKTVLYNNFDYLDDIEYYNNTLYMVTFNETAEQSSVVSLNVTTNTPGTPQLFWADTNSYAPYNAVINGTKMYLNGDFQGSIILEVDLANPSATPVIVASQFTFNNNLIYTNDMIMAPGNIMYIVGEGFDGDEDQYVLYRADLNSLSTGEFSLSNSVKLFPNPATDSFTIANYENGNSYSIYGIDGKLVKQGLYNGEVTVSSLTSGLYLVQLENGKSIKLQKQ